MKNFRKQIEDPVFRPTVSEDVRIYAIGDIHGRIDLLMQLKEKIQIDQQMYQDGRDTKLVFLGDYVDRGDASFEVLQCLVELRQDNHSSAVFLKGNHEDALMRFLEDPFLEANWLQFGGLQTLASFGVTTRLVEPKANDVALMHSEFCGAIRPFLSFLDALEHRFCSGDYFFCHAGVNPEKPLSQQTQRALMWGHQLSIVDQPIPGKRIVHGHYDNIDIDVKVGRVCLDTGAYYSGVLTAMRLDNGEGFLQTDRQ